MRRAPPVWLARECLQFGCSKDIGKNARGGRQLGGRRWPADMPPFGSAPPCARPFGAAELGSLPLPQSVLGKFVEAGYRLVSDLDGLTAEELAMDLAVEPERASQLLALVRAGGLQPTSRPPAHAAPACSARALLEREAAAPRLTTMAAELDTLLGGGVQMRRLTELAGVPGVGKTQLAMQLALSVQLPPALGGAAGAAVYIDTEGSFMASRALQMAKALASTLTQEHPPSDATPGSSASVQLDPRRMLDNIFVYRVHDTYSQLAALRAVAELPSERAVRLVVIDSIAFHVRHADVSFTRRLQMVGQMAQALHAIVSRLQAAAVVINQVTTRVNDSASTSTLVPALGESWAHVCNVQLQLQWRDGERVATVTKGLPPAEATYHITADGVRSPRQQQAQSSLLLASEEPSRWQGQEQRWQPVQQQHAEKSVHPSHAQHHLHLPPHHQPTQAHLTSEALPSQDPEIWHPSRSQREALQMLPPSTPLSDEARACVSSDRDVRMPPYSSASCGRPDLPVTPLALPIPHPSHATPFPTAAWARSSELFAPSPAPRSSASKDQPPSKRICHGQVAVDARNTMPPPPRPQMSQ